VKCGPPPKKLPHSSKESLSGPPSRLEVVTGIWSTIRETKTSNGIVAICTIAIALATIAYFIVSFYQLRAMRQSNEINRQSLQSVQRAFITYRGVRNGRFRTNPTKDLPHYWTFHAAIENSGTTPAITVIAQYQVGVQSPNGPTEEAFRGKMVDNSAPITVGPKATQELGARHIDEALIFGHDLADNLSDMSTATIQPNIFSWGWVVYRDVFPNTRPHVTEFCQVLTGASFILSPSPRITLDLGACREHNCTDNECKDYDKIMEIASGGNG